MERPASFKTDLYILVLSSFYKYGINVTAKITTIRSTIFPNDFIRGILINHCLYFNRDLTLRKRKVPMNFWGLASKPVLSFTKEITINPALKHITKVFTLNVLPVLILMILLYYYGAYLFMFCDLHL